MNYEAKLFQLTIYTLTAAAIVLTAYDHFYNRNHKCFELLLQEDKDQRVVNRLKAEAIFTRTLLQLVRDWEAENQVDNPEWTQTSSIVHAFVANILIRIQQ